jgi:hypothetical protein
LGTIDRKELPVHVYEVGRCGAYELTILGEKDPLCPPNHRLNPWITSLSEWTISRHWLILGGLLVVAVLLLPVSRS